MKNFEERWRRQLEDSVKCLYFPKEEEFSMDAEATVPEHEGLTPQN